MVFMRIFKRIYSIHWKHKKNRFKFCGNSFKVEPFFKCRELENISIGNNFTAGKNCKIESYEYYNGVSTEYQHTLTIKNNISLAPNVYISCANEIIIEDGCLLGENCFITDNYHGRNSKDELDIPPADRKLYSKGPVHIGKNVWLGRNVCVMPNVTIGDYAVIGANSVVTHDIPAYAIAAGCPAKVIKTIN